MKKFFLLPALLLCSLFIKAQNPPVAVNDTVTTLSEKTVFISALLNDYDPDGDTIEISYSNGGKYGKVSHTDSLVIYTPKLYVGLDSVVYRVMETFDHHSRSNYAQIYINILENPDLPVAAPDSATVLQMVPTQLFLLQNDTDPNGNELLINEIYYNNSFEKIEIAEDSMSVIIKTRHPSKDGSCFFLYNVIQKNTPERYYSYFDTVFIEVLDNPEVPYAYNDEANGTGGVPVDIDVLSNDSYLSGLNMVVTTDTSTYYGTKEIVDNHLIFTPKYSFTGTAYLTYILSIEGKPYLYDYGHVTVQVQKNPSCPVAVNDTMSGKSGTDIVLDVLQNDYDIDGDDLEIMETETFSYSNAEIVDNKIIYSQREVLNQTKDSIQYRIREVNNPESYSEWATVIINLEPDPQYPVTHPDHASPLGGRPVTVDILADDELNGNVPTHILLLYSDHDKYKYGPAEVTSDNKVLFKPYMSAHGTVQIEYALRDDSLDYISKGNLTIQIINNHSYDSLDINNINAGINSDGFLFAKVYQVPGDWGRYYPDFMYPNGSIKTTIDNSTLWIAGIDENDSLHVAAQQFKHSDDFQPGPVSDNYNATGYFAKWSRVWKLSKGDIAYHKNNYWKEGYTPIEAIATWPGNGDVNNGQAQRLAPFYDKNNNGIYEPMEGDYPLIRGDQSVLFIYNDDKIHEESKGEKLKVDIIGMAYEYNNPDDTALNNTVFVHYDIFNRSENTYYNTYLGIYTGIDVGYNFDNYIGSNVELGSYYGYNAKPVDGNGEPESYGENPPAQSVTFLSGPYMDADNMDNESGQCDYGVNGFNFGDGIVDNERYGMTGFLYYTFGGNPAHSVPEEPQDYYNYMRSIWKDDTPIMYGGDGYDPELGTVGPQCWFMFPGSSDSCNWGTNGIPPNGGYNQNGKYWTEETGNNGKPNQPFYRQGVGSTGPFTFKPGDKQELDMAYVIGRGDDGPNSSVEQLFRNIEDLLQKVRNGEIVIPEEELSVNEPKDNKAVLKIYPNPAKSHINFVLSGMRDEIPEYVIYNNLGKPVIKGSFDDKKSNTVNIEKLQKGIYFIKIEANGTLYSGKFIKM